MLTSNGHTIAGVINKSLQFDPVKDFAGITPVATVPVVLIVPPDLPAKTVKEFIELAKASPGKLNFASPGLASATFIAAAMFKEAAKIEMQHVPYKGAPEAVTSVMRGDTQMYFTPINVGAELVQAGKVRALAVATENAQRDHAGHPDHRRGGAAGFQVRFLVWPDGPGRHAA